MTAAWRYAYASVAGTSHEKSGAPCQDAGACRVVETSAGGSILLAMASDGAGSARRSEEGARLAVALFLDQFGQACRERGIAAIDRPFILAWLTRLRRRIWARAARAGIRAGDYACTALGAVIADDRAVFFQIGDGAIVVAGRDDHGDYDWVFWPQHGEFANTTNFVTQRDAARALEIEMHTGAIDEVALFTDGIERLVLDLRAKTAHAPFFRPLFGWLAATKPPETSETSPALVNYLGSKQVCDRTDDDKTLVMATRRPAPEARSAASDAAAAKSAAAG
ncbi:MAG TPA: PP2C family serine/threonine-protein phosphatase [Stellaceae bacterium]|nr:PP2C family serine/threonine-protein phosphatase [Stellaceae bacterium]